MLLEGFNMKNIYSSIIYRFFNKMKKQVSFKKKIELLLTN